MVKKPEPKFKFPKPTAFEWVKLFLGCGIWVFMLYLYVFVKEFNILLFGMPAILAGVEVAKWFEIDRFKR